MRENNLRIGIDLGGTKIEALLTDSAGNEIRRARVKTPPNSYSSILESIADLLSDISAPPDLPVGIGMPGSISPLTGHIRNANTTSLNGRPFQADLEKILGRPVRLANDANCFTLSESKDGAAKNFSLVFGIILGTGVGGGISVNSNLIEGVNAISGEWGHNRMPNLTSRDSERKCYCGRTNCVETWLSGPGLSRTYETISKRMLPAEDIVKFFYKGDEKAVETVSRYLDQLADALSGVINILDPDVIVIGGGLSNIDEIYNVIPGRLERLIFSDYFETKILKAEHGDSSGVRGASWLW